MDAKSAMDAPAETGFRCIHRIATGGYGSVYLLRRTRRSTGAALYVAGKFVYRHAFGSAEDPSSRAAYQRAFDGLRNFRSLIGESPYLLRISEVRPRHEAGYFCYIMELADDIETGQLIEPQRYQPRTLRNELERFGKRSRLPSQECLSVAIALGHGLKALHEGGFTHRDLRPSNIIFVKGVPKLADVDLVAEHDVALVSYIPKEYAAPERSHSIQADIYSFGKTLYEMSTGLSVKEFPRLPPDVRHWQDHALFLRINKIIAKACARRLSDRFRSAQELLRELEGIQ